MSFDRPEVPFQPGDTVQYMVPAPALGCTAVIREVYYMAHMSEDLGFALVEITNGNDMFPVGCLTTWYWSAMQHV